MDFLSTTLYINYSVWDTSWSNHTHFLHRFYPAAQDWSYTIKHSSECVCAHRYIPVKMGCCLMVCVGLRDLLLVSVRLAVFRVILTNETETARCQTFVSRMVERVTIQNRWTENVRSERQTPNARAVSNVFPEARARRRDRVSSARQYSARRLHCYWTEVTICTWTDIQHSKRCVR